MLRRSSPTDSARKGLRAQLARGPVRALLAVAAVGAVAGGVPLSGASFSSTTANPGASVAAAADWVAPTVAVRDPGSPLRGTVALGATATDTGSGVRTVAIQVAPNAGDGSTYKTVCTATTSPYSCALATTGLADGPYKLRAIATDRADNAATSAVVSDRLVDNTAPTATLASPGSPLEAGDVPLTATAQDATSGVAAVTIQRAPAGGTAWTDVCTVGVAPYRCDWEATPGTYDLRAVVVDRAGNRATSAVVGGRVITDSVRPFGVTPLGTINGKTPGRIETTDQIVLTYSEPLLLSTVVPGWTGTGTSPVFSVHVRTPTCTIFGCRNDTLDFVDARGTVTANLGTIDLGENGYSPGGALGSGLFVPGDLYAAATATATENADGTLTIAITLGELSGTVSKPVSGTHTMTWTPATAVRDRTGNAGVATAVRQAPAANNF